MSGIFNICIYDIVICIYDTEFSIYVYNFMHMKYLEPHNFTLPVHLY